MTDKTMQRLRKTVVTILTVPLAPEDSSQGVTKTPRVTPLIHAQTTAILQALATEIERAEVEALKKLNKSRKLMQTPYKPGTVKSGIYQQGAQDAHKVWHEQIDEILQSKTGGDNANRSDT